MTAQKFKIWGTSQVMGVALKSDFALMKQITVTEIALMSLKDFFCFGVQGIRDYFFNNKQLSDCSLFDKCSIDDHGELALLWPKEQAAHRKRDAL